MIYAAHKFILNQFWTEMRVSKITENKSMWIINNKVFLKCSSFD